MAIGKNGKKLPKGMSWREDKQCYMGRFQYHGELFTLYGKTIKEVQKKIDDTRYEVQHGTHAKNDKITLNSWFDTWMQQYKKNTVKIGTYTIYQNNYTYYVQNELGNKRIADIRAEHIQKIYNDLAEKKKFATGSIKLVSAMLNGCFKQAVKNKIIKENPVLLATITKGKPRKERKVFTLGEQKIFLQYAEQSYLYDFFTLALMTGMRNGELRGLQWRDIDLKKKVIHVNHTLINTKEKGYFLDTPKTRTSKREIPIMDKSHQLLNQMYKKYKNFNIVQMKDDRYVFSLEGKPISRDRVTLEIDKVVKLIKGDRIEFDKITCHCFRHTFATRCIENGMPPQVLKTILGHSTLSMTMDLYSHVLPDTKQEEMKKIENIF
ncbi:MAG: integrase family protein [Anaerocolumna sp.]|jgi:integrase|nr:integrase family protein [Anaerocolumna sp.]